MNTQPLRTKEGNKAMGRVENRTLSVFVYRRPYINNKPKECIDVLRANCDIITVKIRFRTGLKGIVKFSNGKVHEIIFKQ